MARGEEPDQPLYDSGSSVELTATRPGWHFVGWSGAPAERQPAERHVDEREAITATFAINQYALTSPRRQRHRGEVPTSALRSRPESS
jgi:hypothetical protein